MRIVICGAGQVGFNLARYLAADGNDVVIVDQSRDLIEKIGEVLDVQAIHGHASMPKILHQAGLSSADVFIAVTAQDETNMVACQVAHSLFRVPVKIARIREQDYLQPLWVNFFSPTHMPVDHIISPELEVAHAIERRMSVPGALDLIPVVGGKVKLVAVYCQDKCPVINTPLRQLGELFPDLNVMVVGILREGKPIVPTANDQMLEGDQVYFFVDTAHLKRAMVAFGYEDAPAKRVVIAGSGHVGYALAKNLKEHNPETHVSLIEHNRARAESIAESLPDIVVYHGSVLDTDVLRETNCEQSDVFISVTNDDETNILGSMLAKQIGCKRSISLLKNSTYDPIAPKLGIDALVSPNMITVSTILKCVRRGKISAVHSLRGGLGEIFVAELCENSSLIGKPIRELNLPQGILLGALVREGRVIIPKGGTVVKASDLVVVFAARKAVKKAEEFFLEN